MSESSLALIILTLCSFNLESTTKNALGLGYYTIKTERCASFIINACRDDGSSMNEAIVSSVDALNIIYMYL